MSGAWSDLTRPPLRVAALRAALLDGEGCWRALDVVESTGSTNADLAARARTGEAGGAVLVAEYQSAGRGRLARTWTAPPRSSLAVSVLLRPTAPTSTWSWLPLLAGVALAEALTRTCGVTARLKWPNDVLLPEPVAGQGAGDVAGQGARHAAGHDAGLGGGWRKVAGLLAEAVDGEAGRGAVGTRAVVIGVGLNVSQTADELPVPMATSLRLAGAAVIDRDTLLRAYLRALSDRFRRWDGAGGHLRLGGVAAAYRELCVTLGSDVRVDREGREPLTGRAVAVDDDGRLVVEFAGERHLLAAGDVVHVRSGRPT